MFRIYVPAVAFLVVSVAISPLSSGEKNQTLLERIREWQYPDSEMKNGAQISDAATVNKKGQRTRPSSHAKTVLTTRDSVAQVMEYYKSKLNPAAEAKDANSDDDADEDSERSVTFFSDSDDRSVTIQMIFINTNETSTTLVISRGENDVETHIAWSQYIRH